MIKKKKKKKKKKKIIRNHKNIHKKSFLNITSKTKRID